MAYAVRLAEKGRYFTSPNPMVGACVVKSGRLVGEGAHLAYGLDHAEIAALKKAGKKARGATLYVTLEPCSSWGKTPPCTDAVVESGVREVVIGSLDPNPQNAKKSLAVLKRAGIRVKHGILENEIRCQNESFFKWIRTKIPFVTLKMAQSLDGKIATRTGHSRWISSPAARDFVHRLRREQDAILVGTETLKRDNPFLSPRIKAAPGLDTKPWRIAIDPRFEISSKARIFEGPQQTLVAVSEKVVKSKAFSKKKTKAAVLPVAEKNGRLDLQDLLRKLGALGVAKLLVEGGGELAWSFVEAGLVDKFYWIVAPKFIGGRDSKTSLEGEGVALASSAFPCEISSYKLLGGDLLLEGKLK